MKKEKLKELLHNKKILYPVLLGIAVLAFLIWLIIHFSFSVQGKYSPLDAVPKNAAMIFEIKQPESMWSELSVNSGVWRELTKFETFTKLNSDIIFLDSLFNKNDCAKKIIKDHSIYISFHFLPDNTCGFLYLTSLSGECKKSSVDELIKQVSKSKVSFGEISSKGANITEVTFPNHKEKFYYTVIKDIFICSFRQELMESAINQQNSGSSVLKDEGFIKVSETAGKKVDADLYINFKYFPQFFSSLLSDDYKKKILDLTGFADWSALDVSVKSDVIMLNGFTNTSDTSANYLNLFAGQEPHEMSMLEVIPSSTASFVYFGFSDFEKWHKLYLQYVSKKGKLNEYNARISGINKEYNTDIEKNITTWIGKEMALVITEPSDSDITSNMYAVFKAENISNALTLLSPQSEIQSQKADNSKKEKKNKKGKKKNAREKEKKQQGIPIEIKNNKIYEYKVTGALPALFGKLFEGVSGKYYAVAGDYVIFANSVKALTSFLKDYADEKTLSDNNNYVSFSKNISGESNIYLYCNIKKSLGIILKYANKNVFKSISDNLGSFKNFDAFACQLKSSGKLFYGNICLKTNTSVTEESSALWTYKLDTSICNYPQVVTDISGKSKKIIAFDCASNMYMIEKDGLIKWKIQLKEKPLSKVFVVDLDKNGKCEYVFNTQSYIYCIDDDGKSINNFPVHLNDASTAPMTVVDYADNKDYRFIISYKNKILNFLKNGLQNKGWTVVNTKSNIYKDVTDLKFNGTDYLITSDNDGNIYILDKKGTEKIKIKSSFSVASYSKFYLMKADKKNKASILTTDNTGNLVFISASGEIEKKTIAKFSPFHYFLFDDFNNDKSKEYLFVDNNKLTFYNSDLKQICSYTVPAEISEIPILYKEPNNKISIGLVSSKINKIYLINSDCILREGFPLNGSTTFTITSLNSDGALNLIVGSDRTVYNYSLNDVQ